MQITGDDFKITFDNNSSTINFSGSLRLWDPNEYQKIKQFMLDVYDLNLKQLTLDFRNLVFLNSSGISTLCKFIIEVKKIDKMPIIIIGNNQILWQTKSFQNLKLLWNKIELKFAPAV